MNIRTRESIKMKNQENKIIHRILLISSIVSVFAAVPGLVGIGTAFAEDIINTSLTLALQIDKVWNIVS